MKNLFKLICVFAVVVGCVKSCRKAKEGESCEKDSDCCAKRDCVEGRCFSIMDAGVTDEMEDVFHEFNSEW